MNQLLMTKRGCLLDEWLRQSAPEVCQVGDRRWRVSLGNGVSACVLAPVDDTFLLFDAPAPVTCELEKTPHWLRWNAALAGNAKIALVPNPWQVKLRAEIPMDDEVNPSARIAETLHGLHDACQLLKENPSSASNPRQTGPVMALDDTPIASRNLPALLRDTGWSFQERTPGVAVVELAMRGRCCRVLLEENTLGVRAAVELLRAAPLTKPSEIALAALLLGASGALRFARPYATKAEEQFTCGFEVRFAGETTASELEHALEALAVACGVCHEEVNSLLDNSVAESYLAIRNLPPTIAREEQ